MWTFLQRNKNECFSSLKIQATIDIHFYLISELYEGLKRAQRSRLDDQRGTEINFELPDFLKCDQPQVSQ